MRSFNVEGLPEGEEQQAGCLLWRSHHEHLIYANTEVVFLNKFLSVTQWHTAHLINTCTDTPSCNLQISSPATQLLLYSYVFCPREAKRTRTGTDFLSVCMFHLHNYFEHINKHFLLDLYQKMSGVKLCCMLVKCKTYSNNTKFHKR